MSFIINICFFVRSTLIFKKTAFFLSLNTSYYCIIYLVFLLVSSCTENSILKEYDNKNVIHISQISDIMYSKYSDYYEDLKFIHLETKEDCLIGRIDKLLAHNGFFFILDQVESKGVFVFDDKGKFITKIGGIGRGPGEFAEPNDIAIDKKRNEFLVWSNDDRKLLFYDLDNFKYLRSITLPIYAKTIAVLDNKTYALYADLGNDNLNRSMDHNLYLVTEEGVIVNKGLPIQEKNYGQGGFHFFNEFNNRLQISPAYNNTIHSVTRDSLISKYEFDFANFSIPEELFLQEKYKFLRELKTSDYAYLRNYFELSNYLLFSFVRKGLIYNGYFSKETGKIMYSNFPVNDIKNIISGSIIATYDDNHIISYYDPANVGYLQELITFPINRELVQKKNLEAFKMLNFDIRESVNSIEKMDSIIFSYTKRDIDYLQNIDPSSNPILIINKLKEF